MIGIRNSAREESYSFKFDLNSNYLSEVKKDDDKDSQNVTYSIENDDLETLAMQMLGPWERWRLKKKFEEEKINDMKKEKEKEEALMKEKMEKLKLEKEAKQNEELKKWIERKKLEAIKNSVEKKTKEEMEELKKTKEKQHMKKLREGTYSKWWTKLEKDEEMRKLEMKKKKEKLREEAERKKEKSEKAFKEWCEKVKDRPKTTQHYGLAVANGKVLKYYDWSTNPEPTYVNPKAWCPIEVPKNNELDNEDNKRRAKSASIVRQRSCVKFFDKFL